VTVSVATLGERALRRLGVAIVPVADRPALAAPVALAAIATNALLWLAIIASDETPSPADAALALAKAAAVHDGLIAQGFVSWAASAVPSAVAEDYARLTAMYLAPAFGKAADPAQLPVIEARIRKIAQIMAAPALAADEVLGVHQDLAARGLVRWSSFDIPDAAADCYVRLAADQLAGQFGLKADPRDALAAERSLARYIALPTSGERVQGEYY